MKSTVVVPNVVPVYPYLGTGVRHLIVMFTSHNCGVVLVPGESQWKRGHYADDWKEKAFRVFDGLIELSN